MHFLENYYKKIIKRDLLNKFTYHNINELPELKKIILNFGSKNNSIRQVAVALLALELLTETKGEIMVSKTPNLFLKIQKGHPTGCKVVLKKKKVIYIFLGKLLSEIIPKIKNFSGLVLHVENDTFSFKLKSDTMVLKELEEQYPLFSGLPSLDVVVKTSSKTEKELLFLIKSLKLLI